MFIREPLSTGLTEKFSVIGAGLDVSKDGNTKKKTMTEDTTPEVIVKARAITRSVEPDMPCTAWICPTVEKLARRVAELEIEKEGNETPPQTRHQSE